VLPYGTQVRATSARISLTCVATCRHGNACGLVAERGPGGLVALYFHGTELHGARLDPTQIDALSRWLAGDHEPRSPNLGAPGGAGEDGW
jgi:hypothetical protein